MFPNLLKLYVFYVTQSPVPNYLSADIPLRVGRKMFYGLVYSLLII